MNVCPWTCSNHDASLRRHRARGGPAWPAPHRCDGWLNLVLVVLLRIQAACKGAFREPRCTSVPSCGSSPSVELLGSANRGESFILRKAALRAARVIRRTAPTRVQTSMLDQDGRSLEHSTTRATAGVATVASASVAFPRSEE